VTLAVVAPGKPGAKKRPPTPRQVPWAQLGAGRVQVEFGRSGTDDPADDTDSTDDADGDLAGAAVPDDISPARGGGQ